MTLCKFATVIYLAQFVLGHDPYRAFDRFALPFAGRLDGYIKPACVLQPVAANRATVLVQFQRPALGVVVVRSLLERLQLDLRARLGGDVNMDRVRAHVLPDA